MQLASALADPQQVTRDPVRLPGPGVDPGQRMLVLQDQLDALDGKAASSPDPDLHSSMRSWEALMRNAKVSPNRSGEEETKRLEIAGDLEVKLKKYRESARVESYSPRTPA